MLMIAFSLELPIVTLCCQLSDSVSIFSKLAFYQVSKTQLARSRNFLLELLETKIKGSDSSFFFSKKRPMMRANTRPMLSVFQ